ncbi:MAG: hypothetical protein ACRDJ5_10530 [Actinomycetota bacterium]
MYTTVKRYELGAGSRGVGAVREIMRRCQEELVPKVGEVGGFASFYVVDAGEGIVAAVSIFEHEAGAEEGNQLVKRFFKERLAGLLQANPQITEGEAVVHQP